MKLPCLVSLLAALAGAAAASAAMQAVRLKCELTVDPLGVDVTQPALSWQVDDVRPGARQTAWQVLVASRAELLAQDRGDLWDSGRVAGDQTTFVPYAGAALVSSQCVFWKIRAWDADGQLGDWSAPATWTMGLLQPSDWRGQWITTPQRVENMLARTEFDVRPGLLRAVAHVSGLGQYELFFNGAKAGRDLLAPGWTDYRDAVLYDTRDVTALLRPGRNAVGFALGNGMLHVQRAPGRFAKFVASFGAQRALLHLRLEYADGTVQIVGTDPSWRVTAGPITFSSIYGGEDFDARRVPAGWNLPGFAATGWSAAVPATEKLGPLYGLSHAAEPIVPIETRAPVAVRDLGPGVQLVDFGQNTSFMPRIRVSGPAGSVIKLTAGEIVNADGTINRGTMGGAHRGSAWWQYTKATAAEETWFPQFYYLGSRYLYVELQPAAPGGALPKLEAAEMVIIHSAAEPRGHFAASDPQLGRIRDLIVWAQRSNLVSIITDCPHREKLGWLEQMHLCGPSLRYEWDVARLLAKTSQDMADAQTADGLVPNIAPEYVEFKGSFRATAEWGASFILVPWQHYVFTGDTRLLRLRYAAMKRYFAYLEQQAVNGTQPAGLGDWYDVELGVGKRANLTPGPVTATAHYYLDAVTLAQIAQVLGQPADAASFHTKAAAIRTAARREFLKPGAKEIYGSGSDTSLAVALALGLVEPAERDAVLAALVRSIETRGYATSGAVGYRYLLQALTAGGRTDLILRQALNPDVPGYAYQLKQGLTALAESWTALPGASHDHFFLGHIIEWFYADLVGLAPDPEQPGFKRLLVRPHPQPTLTWAEASHDSLHGRHTVRWEQTADRFTLTVTVPANTTARVYVPGREAAAADGTKPTGAEGERTVFDVGAGRHVFTSRR